MGVSGTAIFGDDVACDVRDAYRRLVADGFAGPKATNQLLQEWKETLADEDDGPVFWLALAATQWQCGRLEARVKTRALKTIAKVPLPRKDPVYGAGGPISKLWKEAK